jgi:hypothetical protein
MPASAPSSQSRPTHEVGRPSSARGPCAAGDQLVERDRARRVGVQRGRRGPGADHLARGALDRVDLGEPAGGVGAAHRDRHRPTARERAEREGAARDGGGLVGRDQAIGLEHDDRLAVGERLQAAAVRLDRAPELVVVCLGRVAVAGGAEQHHGPEPALAARDRRRAGHPPRRHGAAVPQGPDRGQRRREALAVARPERGIFGQHLRDQRVEILGHLGPQRAHPRRLAEQDLGQERGRAVTLERGRAGEAQVQHAAEREHVRARVDRGVGARLLRRHVARGADQDAGLGEGRAALALRDPEIDHLDLIDPAAGEEEVAGLEIAVDDPAGVGGAEGGGDAGGEGDGLAHGEGLALEAGLEVLAVEPLHGQVELARGRLAVGDVADDAGVRELREQLDLALEPRGAVPVRVGDDLDRHGLVRGAIAGAEDLAHAAGSDRLLDLEPLTQQSPEPHRRALIILRGTIADNREPPRHSSQRDPGTCDAWGHPGAMANPRFEARARSARSPAC